MNNILTQLIENHALLLQEAKETLKESGGCDHSVGICHCHTILVIDQGDALQIRFSQPGSAAASILGSATSKAKAKASRANGKMGGRPRKMIHEISFLRGVENRAFNRLGRKVALDDVSTTELEQLWFLSNPHNASNKQFETALNKILKLE